MGQRSRPDCGRCGFESRLRERPRNTGAEAPQPREKSPQSVLKEAKEKLKNYARDHPAHASTTRDKSPSSVLREAKMRLRKLEIEAEAVEKSYLDFRRRQQLKQDREDVVDVTDMSNFQNKYEFIRKEEPRLKLYDLSSDRIANYANEYAKLNTMSYFRNRISALSKAQPIPSTLTNVELELKQSEQRRDYYLETPLTEFRKLYHSQRSVVIEKSVKNKSNVHYADKINEVTPVDKENSIQDYTESKSELKSPKSKEDEMEIPKDYITKIDHHDKEDIQEKITPVEDYIDKINILDTINQEPQDTLREIPIEEIVHLSNEAKNNEKPDTSIEIPTIEEIVQLSNDEVKPNEKPELLVVVESTIDTKEIDISQTDMHEKIPTEITIIVSPKRTEPFPEIEEQAARLTKNDALTAIFHSEAKADSSVEIELNISQEAIEKSSEIEKGGEEYADDFSADVENSRSEYETHSPISLPKNSEDDNFWDTN